MNSDSHITLEGDIVIGLEISRHIGPRVLYGYISILFEKKLTNDVEIEIPYIYENSEKYDESVLYNKEYCYKGILKEYVDDIAMEIKNYIGNTKNFPHCNIKIIDGANCEIGSCTAFYKIIINILLNIFSSGIYKDIYSMKDEDLINAVKSGCIL